MQSTASANHQGRTFHFGDHSVTCDISAATTGGSFSLFTVNADPGAGTPPHVHHDEDETFYILEGRFAVAMEGSVTEAGPGACVFAPRHRAHYWRNVGDAPGRMVVLATPGGFEHFFADLERIGALSATPDAAAIAKLMEVFVRHNIEPAAPIK